MSILTITKHLGRLGNNMTYILNAIDYCIKNNFNVLKFGPSIPSNVHRLNILIEGDSMVISDPTLNHDKAAENKGFWGHYFYRGEVPFSRRRELCLTYIVPKLKFKPSPIDPNALVIHIRGGDIFDRQHYAYVQPPLSFYENIINSRKWSTIYLCSENNKNPCFDILKKKYNCVSCLDNRDRHGGNYWGFQEDLSLMIGATHFVASKTSLSPLIIYLSKTIQHVYLADYFLRTGGSSFEKAENSVWWSNELTNKKSDFHYGGIDFHVQNYTKYIEMFNKTNYDLSKKCNSRLLVEN